MAKARDILSELKTRLAALKPAEKAAFAAFGVTVVLALVLISAWGARPRYASLVSGAFEDELRDITAVLDEKGEEYKVEEGGKVLVRQERRPVLAGEISRLGVVPGQKIIGFSEVIEKDGFYTTRDRRRLMMQVALQNELSLMISNLSAVETSKVLIKEGRESDIFGDGRPGGASVTVRTRPGERITPELVQSIAGIVKSAVPNIDPADITIVDARGNKTYSAASRDEELFEAPSVFRLKLDVEKALADKVRGMFLHMGVDAVVVVNAELDLQKVAQKVQEVDPQARGPFVTSERRTRKTVSEPVRGGGVVGIEANRGPGTAIGAGGGVAAGTVQPSAPAAASQSSEERENAYTYSYVLREITGAPKGIAKVTASVVLFDRIVEKDGKIHYDGKIIDDRMEDWKQLVASALGVEGTAGVVVKHVPSTGPLPAAAGVGMEFMPVSDILAKGLLLAVAVAVLVGLYLLARRYLAAGAEEPVEEALPTAGTDRITVLQKAIREQAAKQPERLSRIISRWIVSK